MASAQLCAARVPGLIPAKAEALGSASRSRLSLQGPARPSLARRRRGGSARADIRPVDVETAKQLVEQEGYRVLDVRDATQFAKAHIQGCLHVPVFLVNDDPGLGTAIKRQAHRNFAGFLFGLAFTKPNPSFLEDVRKALPEREQGVLVVCQEGLRAAGAGDEMDDIGYSNVAVLARGLSRVPPGTFPTEGPRELQDAGKGGFVAIQTQFSVVLGSILIALLLFVQFFPDTATAILKSVQ